ncbi:hypothetical protein G1J88_11520 [Tenacibaculum dicentrarchi]|uniref:hypothetical protein n=1 Tax=Tenacibaculum finnmarkense TaxID=2781243 RepID=UPI001BE67B85|nr:hypothetical protein [Tenacibaculum dicentrarchi]MCD8416101.1 hypothetical protein [Tenacibaculum dicentrarchi]MCD8419986.1 hypothetical protein [Tenacibaculum dicentrarchi]MCD8438330.1 hypothetical protein [Tenacibaculum dicentrarchi]MCG8829009.1 hypothetical protein [Tenacibaculum dicentrarchi]
MKKTDINIIRRIKAIENSTFTEDDIKLLLIEIRERLKKNRFLTEICHFVAHSERDKGICHKKIDVRYAKLKFIEENTKAKLTQDFIKENKDKPERFTDIILDFIKTEKIEKSLFELIILRGIDDLENEMYSKYYKTNKKRVKSLIINSYELVKENYLIKESIDRKEFLYIDDLLKFICGTVTGKPAFYSHDIKNDFIRAIKKLSVELKHTLNIKEFNKNIDDVILTIITLLQDAQFKLFDGEIGHSFMALHPNDNGSEIYLIGKTGKFSMPLIGTNLKAKKYISKENFETEINNISEIPWTNIYRKENGKIELIKNKA